MRLVVVPGFLDNLGPSLDHQHVPLDLFLPVPVPLDVVQAWLEGLDQWGEVADTGVPVFVSKGWAVLQTRRRLPFCLDFVVRLR